MYQYMAIGSLFMEYILNCNMQAEQDKNDKILPTMRHKANYEPNR